MTILREVLLALLWVTFNAHAQEPFRWEVTTTDTVTTFEVRIERLGDEHYLLVGHGEINGSGWYWQTTLHADGTTTPLSGVRSDVISVPYEPGILRTSDGGHLYSYQYHLNGERIFALIRTDADGATLWEQRYPHTAGTFLSETTEAMVETDSGFVLLGNIAGATVQVGAGSVLMQFNANGELMRARRFSITGDGMTTLTRKLVRTHNDGLYVATVERSYYSQATFPNIVVQRFNSALELEWSKRYRYGYYNILRDAELTEDDGLVLIGSAHNYPSPDRPFIFQVDSTGSPQWGHFYKSTPVIGTRDLKRVTGGEWLWAGRDNDHPVVARMDSVGVLHDAVLLGDQIWQAGLHVIPDSVSGGAILVGARYDDHTLAEVTQLDAFLYPPCGGQPFTLPEDSLRLPEVLDYPVEVTDTMFAFHDTTLAQAPFAAVVALDGCLSTVSGDLAPGAPAELRAWPVPFHNEVHVQLPWEPGNVASVMIVDPSGRVVRDLSGTIAQNMSVPRGDLSPGCYALVVLSRTYERRSVHLVLE